MGEECRKVRRPKTEVRSSKTEDRSRETDDGNFLSVDREKTGLKLIVELKVILNLFQDLIIKGDAELNVD